MRVVDGSDLLHSFDFYYDRIFDDKIHAIAAVESYISINDWQWYLLIDPESHLTKLERKAGNISRFQQSRPDSAVDLNRGPDDAASNRVESVRVMHAKPI